MMSGTPFFSIITPTYNRASFLEEMIASVAAQTFQDYEHIIIDDGSTDETENLIKGLIESNSKIVYIKQRNQGRSTARNVGIEHAKGEYVCFLDSDDFWKEDHLNIHRLTILNSSSPTLIHSGLIWYFEDENRFEQVPFRDSADTNSNVEYVLKQQFAPNTVSLPAFVLRQEKFSASLNVNEDLDLWCRILSDYPLKIVKEYTACLRVHSGNTKFMGNQVAFFQKQIDVFKKLRKTEKTGFLIGHSFARNYLMGLRHAKWGAINKQGSWGHLLSFTFLFCLKYPKNPSVKSKLVVLVKRTFGMVEL